MIRRQSATAAISLFLLALLFGAMPISGYAAPSALSDRTVTPAPRTDRSPYLAHPAEGSEVAAVPTPARLSCETLPLAAYCSRIPYWVRHPRRALRACPRFLFCSRFAAASSAFPTAWPLPPVRPAHRPFFPRDSNVVCPAVVRRSAVSRRGTVGRYRREIMSDKQTPRWSVVLEHGPMMHSSSSASSGFCSPSPFCCSADSAAAREREEARHLERIPRSRVFGRGRHRPHRRAHRRTGRSCAAPAGPARRSAGRVGRRAVYPWLHRG